jgi:hypothetical protein
MNNQGDFKRLIRNIRKKQHEKIAFHRDSVNVVDRKESDQNTIRPESEPNNREE